MSGSSSSMHQPPYKVWRIQHLEEQPRADEARRILERVAQDVEPVMRNHRWRVKLVSEIIRTDINGENQGEGEVIFLLVRNARKPWEFRPYVRIRSDMLHELCHNVCHGHGPDFWKLLGDLAQESGIEIKEQDAKMVQYHTGRDYSGGSNSTGTYNSGSQIIIYKRSTYSGDSDCYIVGFYMFIFVFAFILLSAKAV